MTEEQKNELILRMLDSDLSEQEFELFQNLIQSDTEFLRLYREYVMLEHTLLACHVSMLPSLETTKLERKKGKRNFRIAIFGVAACLILALCAQFFIKSSAPAYHSAKIEFAENSKYVIEGRVKDDELAVGKTIRITQGAAKLELANGVTAVVLAPAVLKIQDETTVLLEQGKASFNVPEQGEGFTVISKQGEIVDLGTQFTVISGWSEIDEIYVEKGTVEVKNHSSGSEMLKLNSGEAASIDQESLIKNIAYEGRQAQVIFPNRVEIVYRDGFEDPECRNGVIFANGLSGWQRYGQKDLEMGIYNPEKGKKWYDGAELDDDSQTGGVVQGMKGPCLAYIIGPVVEPSGVKKKVCNIEKNTLYSFSLTLGVRNETSRGRFANYELALISGGQVIDSIRGSTPPCATDSFIPLSLTWNSSNLPKGINVNDPLLVRIQVERNSEHSGISYIDFDNLNVTKLVQPEKK